MVTTPEELRLSNRQARRLLLARQGLWPPRGRKGPAGVRQTFEMLACVQYDPLDVVGRNPDLVLQSRVADYRRHMLQDLAYADRYVYDYWDKMTAYVPMSDWPSFELRRRAFRELHAGWRRAHAASVDSVVRLLRDQGEMSAIDFGMEEGPGGKVDWRWGPKRAAKAALEMLWDTGEVMVSRREGARRFYDLAERVLPSDIAELPVLSDEDEYTAWKVKRRCRGIGLVGPALGGNAWAGVGKASERSRALDELVARGEMARARVDGDNRTYYMLRDDAPLIESADDGDTAAEAAFIAPLDNLMWPRDLIARLFGFDYVWEVYKPADKRKYGYYVLPVLFGDDFVARFEPKLDRQARLLRIESWYWEPGEALTPELAEALQSAFSPFLSFLEAERIETASGVDTRLAALVRGFEQLD